MKRPAILAFLVLVAVAVSVSAVYGEEIRLTTIIPDQTVLRAKKGTIGNTYSSSTTVPNTTLTDTPDVDLLIEGNVGIGTTKPLDPLTITGDSAHNPGITLLTPGTQTSDQAWINWLTHATSNGVGDRGWQITGRGNSYVDSSVGGAVQNDLLFYRFDNTTGTPVNTNVLTLDYSTANVGIGTTVPQAKLDVAGDGAAIIVPRKSTTGDPSGVNGMIYYNTYSNKFRIFENGAWKDLGGGGGAFGTWTIRTNTGSGDITRATTDGFVTVCAWAKNMPPVIEGFTDSNTSPSTRVSSFTGSLIVGYTSIMFPVRKNDYWKVIVAGANTYTINWLPVQ